MRAGWIAVALLATVAAAKADDAFLWLRNVDGFNSIDDEHIVLSAGRKHALVTTFGPCWGLRDSETIAVDAPLGYLDASGLGKIIYRRGFHDRGSCPIDRVVAVDSVAQAREIVAREKTDKRGPAR